MSNLNFTQCIAVGDCNEIKNLYELFGAEKAIDEWAPCTNWLGEEPRNIEFLAFYRAARLSDDGKQCDFCLQGRRGHPQREIEFLMRKFPKVKIYFYSECENFEYTTNDSKRAYIKIRYVIDCEDGTFYLASKDEVLKKVGELLHLNITSDNQLYEALEKAYNEDGISINMTEVKDV